MPHASMYSKLTTNARELPHHNINYSSVYAINCKHALRGILGSLSKPTKTLALQNFDTVNSVYRITSE